MSWRLNRTATYWPPNSSGHSSISFPFSWVAQPGAWGPSLWWDMVLIPASSLQLIWTSCHRGYIIIWRPPTSCERHNSHSIQPFNSQGCPLISSTGCTCYLHRCISSWPGSICYIRWSGLVPKCYVLSIIRAWLLKGTRELLHIKYRGLFMFLMRSRKLPLLLIGQKIINSLSHDRSPLHPPVRQWP